MTISQEQLEKFKDIYEKQYGVRPSDKEALPEAIALLNLMKVIYRPLPKDTSTDKLLDATD